MHFRNDELRTAQRIPTTDKYVSTCGMRQQLWYFENLRFIQIMLYFNVCNFHL